MRDGILANEIIKELSTAVLRWYVFKDHSKIAYIGEKDSIFESLCEELGDDVDYLECPSNVMDKYDYVICIGYAEKEINIQEYIYSLKELLNSGGVLLLGLNNRLGIRYFCGDRDIYTDRSFDGVEDYRNVYSKREDVFTGRSYDREQIKTMISKAGFVSSKQYSIFPGLEDPSLIYAESFLPNEDLSCRLFPSYHYPDSVSWGRFNYIPH